MKTKKEIQYKQDHAPYTGSFTMEQIKKAFWNQFYESGEKWFPDRRTDHEWNNVAVQKEWDEFIEHLLFHA